VQGDDRSDRQPLRDRPRQQQDAEVAEREDDDDRLEVGAAEAELQRPENPAQLDRQRVVIVEQRPAVVGGGARRQQEAGDEEDDDQRPGRDFAPVEGKGRFARPAYGVDRRDLLS
jgi:hypothetical protein